MKQILIFLLFIPICAHATTPMFSYYDTDTKKYIFNNPEEIADTVNYNTKYVMRAFSECEIDEDCAKLTETSNCCCCINTFGTINKKFKDAFFTLRSIDYDYGYDCMQLCESYKPDTKTVKCVDAIPSDDVPFEKVCKLFD